MMIRGADVLVQTLTAAGVDWVSALSGNQIMSVFDASIGAGTNLIHVRHEAAAVHLADGWGRLTGRPGVALVPAGPGFANCLSALYVARMAESPLLLLSGQAPSDQVGTGTFQEMAQSEMATHVSKASWTVTDAAMLGADVTRALILATSGRPGPVHLCVSVDVLEAKWTGSDIPESVTCGGETASEGIDAETANRVVDALCTAKRPLVLGGPSMCRGAARRMLDSFARTTGVPVVGMESPRGVNDPSLGALAEVLPEADLVLLLAKRIDFTLRNNGELAFDRQCRILQIDPDQAVLDLTRRGTGDPSRILTSVTADPVSSIALLGKTLSQRSSVQSTWYHEVQLAVEHRPEAWKGIDSGRDGPLHPVEVCGAIQEFLNDDDAVFISDGGEFGQWAQACISAPHRLINGPSGAIGGSIPFALAARLAFPSARIIAALGDGTFGFHALEFDTALRHRLPFIAVVGNDAAWNSEYQIQLRTYGRNRTIGCELLPTRYDRVVEAVGGYGESVSSAEGLRPALVRAESSGLPACVNVAIERTAAPLIRQHRPDGMRQ